jgi:hypothetical protein
LGKKKAGGYYSHSHAHLHHGEGSDQRVGPRGQKDARNLWLADGDKIIYLRSSLDQSTHLGGSWEGSGQFCRHPEPPSSAWLWGTAQDQTPSCHQDTPVSVGSWLRHSEASQAGENSSKSTFKARGKEGRRWDSAGSEEISKLCSESRQDKNTRGGATKIRGHPLRGCWRHELGWPSPFNPLLGTEPHWPGTEEG